MSKKQPIPVNNMIDAYDPGITIERLCMDDLRLLLDEKSTGTQSVHRHDVHSFFLLEKGEAKLELDFEHYIVRSPAVIYIHPDQVHSTTTSNDMIIVSLALSNDKLEPEYLKSLADITPAKPITLDDLAFTEILEAATLSLKLYKRKGDKLYHSILKHSCNALVGLMISQYISSAKQTDDVSRFEVITKSFKKLLETDYITSKRPALYAKKLNISTPYLNECVKMVTGYTVSYHIQQRVILEAKRLLCYSNQSVKQIAFALGYDDYPYFSRLFAKVSGNTALAFRGKNCG